MKFIDIASKRNKQIGSLKTQRFFIICSFEMPFSWHHFGIFTHLKVGFPPNLRSCHVFAKRLPLGEEDGITDFVPGDLITGNLRVYLG